MRASLPAGCRTCRPALRSRISRAWHRVECSAHLSSSSSQHPGAALATAAVTCIVSLAACTPSPAWALPPGKIAVTGPELVQIIKEDIQKRKYLVTGQLTKEVYAEDTHFQDSRDDFGRLGLDKWSAAVGFLFQGDRCKLALTAPIELDEQARTITYQWRQVDVFRLPGNPHTKVFTGHTVLTLDPVDNIITDHVETWDESPDEVTGSIKFFDNNFNPPGFDGEAV